MVFQNYLAQELGSRFVRPDGITDRIFVRIVRNQTGHSKDTYKSCNNAQQKSGRVCERIGSRELFLNCFSHNPAFPLLVCHGRGSINQYYIISTMISICNAISRIDLPRTRFQKGRVYPFALTKRVEGRSIIFFLCLQHTSHACANSRLARGLIRNRGCFGFIHRSLIRLQN